MQTNCVSIAGVPALKPGYNPATWMLEVTGGSMATLVQVRLHTCLRVCIPALMPCLAYVEVSPLFTSFPHNAYPLIVLSPTGCGP